MKTLFHYDSREHHQPFNRVWRFVAFSFIVAAVLFLFYLAFIFAFEWSSDPQELQLWHILLTIFAIAGSLALLFILLVKRVKVGYTDFQQLVVTDQEISWLLSAKEERKIVRFDDIETATEDARHLILDLKNGDRVWVENYTLIDKESQWSPFITAVRKQINVCYTNK